ncbi:NAD-dependent epimerase/dehydratase family protein [Amycolatopsis jejuensis]|uniref:NAD-dependent epimerase/dehydratase family protein n=1 Tax=Amycolatopsis jejuensis TaxID=330084 RepID=UPI000525B6DE|nr:NAD(P)-dependent oxidoreductase [Amycolatopsis jejuensis]
MKRVVVTGGSGRLGRYVLAEFADGYDVVNADLKPGPDGEYRPMDLTDPDQVRRALNGADVVVHLAGIDYDFADDPDRTVRVNVMGAWHVLQAARELNVGRVVLCSSVAALGLHEMRPDWVPANLPVDDSHEARPVDPYGISKAALEVLGRGMSDGGLSVVCLRPCAVVFADNAESVLTSAPGTLHDYVAAEDVARAFRAAAEAAEPGFGPYLLCADDSAHPEPTMQWYESEIGPPPGVLTGRTGVFSNAGARRALGWHPASSRDGLLKDTTLGSRV